MPYKNLCTIRDKRHGLYRHVMFNNKKLIMAKSKLTILLLLLLLLLFPVKNYGQFWPITPMVRYGNIIYYELGNENSINLTKPHTIFDKKIENRFFDILTEKDSIGIKMNDQVVYFSQNHRKEPRDQKVVPFYSRRFLQNENAIIRYLKIKEIRENVIIAEATIKNKSGNRSRKKQLIQIYIDDLDGVFIGPGENQRTGHYILGWGGVLAARIFVFSK